MNKINFFLLPKNKVVSNNSHDVSYIKKSQNRQKSVFQMYFSSETTEYEHFVYFQHKENILVDLSPENNILIISCSDPHAPKYEFYSLIPTQSHLENSHLCNFLCFFAYVHNITKTYFLRLLEVNSVL